MENANFPILEKNMSSLEVCEISADIFFRYSRYCEEIIHFGWLDNDGKVLLWCFETVEEEMWCNKDIFLHQDNGMVHTLLLRQFLTKNNMICIAASQLGRPCTVWLFLSPRMKPVKRALFWFCGTNTSVLNAPTLIHLVWQDGWNYCINMYLHFFLENFWVAPHTSSYYLTFPNSTYNHSSSCF